MSALTINDFILLLSSKEPAPGGGAASALVGAIGSALSSMVANLTIGKQKFQDKELLMKEILKEGEELQKNLITLIDKDTEAFARVAEVFRMAKDTVEQKDLRDKAMQTALKEATVIPLSIMEKSVKALQLHERALGNSNPATASDIGVGALCLKAALQGGWLNVMINLNNINDVDFVQEHKDKGEELLNEGIKLADKIYQKVLENL
ncbi:MAG: methenyltetrahydrofolate cyclohydrolase [Tepidanaerobacteraceae bacterium]|nr:methenyltetrahydrofolate cyclohydrolase [Tepidanaerobacteraceae bacterium]